MGEALLEVVRPAAPCRLMDDLIGPGAMKALHARGGTVFRILEGGVIRVGDPVVREDGRRGRRRAPERASLAAMTRAAQH